MEFPQATWIIRGLLPVGLTLLVGKPKLGKSIIAQNLCLSVVQGNPALGKFPTERGSCLNLCLEDPLWQFQARLDSMMNGDDPRLLGNAHVFNRWPRMPEGLRLLDEWLGQHPTCRLVIIDTLVGFRAHHRQEAGIYDRDHSEVSEIQRLAVDRNVAIVVVSHERKAESTDILDRPSGSIGIVAAADHVWMFERPIRTKAEATLVVSGRTLRDVSYKLIFNENNLRWRCDGVAKEIELSENEKKIIVALRTSPVPLRSVDIHVKTRIPQSTIYRTLANLQQLNMIQYSHGTKRYSYP